MFEKIKNIIAMAKTDAAKFMDNRLAQTANITGIAMAIFVLVVIGYVSIYVVNEIHGIAGITSGSVFFTASNKVISVMNTSWGRRIWAHIKHFKQSITNIQKSNSRVICECLSHQNDVNSCNRSFGWCKICSIIMMKWVHNHSSDKRRIRGHWRCWRDITTITAQRYNNKRGAVPSPTFIFSAQKHTEYL